MGRPPRAKREVGHYSDCSISNGQLLPTYTLSEARTLHYTVYKRNHSARNSQPFTHAPVRVRASVRVSVPVCVCARVHVCVCVCVCVCVYNLHIKLK